MATLLRFWVNSGDSWWRLVFHSSPGMQKGLTATSGSSWKIHHDMNDEIFVKFSHLRVNAELVHVEGVEIRHQNVLDDVEVANEKGWCAHSVDANVASCWV
jgi:hypothetical protein